MKRKTLKNLLAVMAILCVGAGAAACGGGGNNNSSSQSSSVEQSSSSSESSSSVETAITLVEFEDEAQDVGYGEMYTLSLTAKDTNGKLHAVKGSVATANGAEVDVLNGKFVVNDKGGYVVTYSFTSAGETFTRKVTLTVKALAKPVIQIDGQTTAMVCGDTYTVPTATAYDYFDGDLSLDTNVYKKNANGEDTQIEFDETTRSFVTEEAGEYYVSYQATNSTNTVETKNLPFYVRKTAAAGEWDTFDDIGCLYTVNQYDALNKSVWHETFENRSGVLELRMKESNYGTYFSVLPKTTDKANFENYSHVAVSVYYDGDVNDTLNVRLMTDMPLDGMKSGEWTTLYFDAASWQKRFAATGGVSESTMRCVGSLFESGKLYIDQIQFVNATELSCSFTEENGSVAPVFSNTDNALPTYYKVTYNGKEVKQYNGKFKADYVGDYVIEPMYADTDKTSFERFVYHSAGANALQLNAYDTTVSASADTYVQPQVKVVDGSAQDVDGYTLKTVVTYVDTLGVVRTVKGIDQAKKGWYTYTFTAKKDGEKNLQTSATVRVGDFIDGEIVRVADTDAPKRFSGMLTTATSSSLTLNAETNETENLPESMLGKTYVKYAYDPQATYTTNSSYINFNSVMLAEEIQNCAENEVQLSFYFKAKPQQANGALPQVNMTFLGQKFTLTANAINTVRVSYSTLLARYKKLATHTTWADYAIQIDTTIREFSEFTFYFDDIKMLKTDYLPYAVEVTEGNKSLIYNPDVAGTYFAADSAELSKVKGDYDGNAVGMRIWSNPAYRAKNVYKPSQLAEFAKTYNTVTLNLAITGVDKGSFLLINSGGKPTFVSAACNGSYTLNSTMNNQWMTFSISLRTYISLLEQNNYEYVTLFNSYTENALFDDDNGNGKTDAEERGFFYVADIEFSYVAPAVVKVDETNFKQINMYDGYATYTDKFIAAGSDEIKDFKGGYTGNATRLQIHGNPGYRFKNNYSLEELEEIKNNCNSVTLWFAFGNVTGGNIWLEDNSQTRDYFHTQATCDGKLTSFTAADSNTWYKWVVDIDDYIALVTEEDGAGGYKAAEYCYMFSSVTYGITRDEGDFSYFYIGDILFENVAE